MAMLTLSVHYQHLICDKPSKSGNFFVIPIVLLCTLTFGIRVIYFYRPQRSCGKVMFSEACVKNSVHTGGGGVCPSAC